MKEAIEEARRQVEKQLSTLRTVLEARKNKIICANCGGTGVTHKHLRNSIGTYGIACIRCDGEGKYEMTLQPGDTCLLKFGGPVLTVISLNDNVTLANVCWFNNEGGSYELKHATLPVAGLKLYPPRED